MKFLVLLSLSVLFLVAAPPVSRPVVMLWPEGAPGALGSADEDRPRYTVYLPEAPMHTGVLICPGGGYHNLAMDHEGDQVARWLNGYGITAFVLQYRLGPKYHHPVELNDALRAMRMIRAHASEYSIDQNRLGILGFSAGGHLASTVSTHFDLGKPGAKEMTERYSSRPAFAVLAYPVISFVEFAHAGSRENLLGENPDPKLLQDLSNELRVSPQTPPTFLFHTADDTVVPVQNSLLYFEALRKNNVPAELHVFEHGAHGVGLAPYDPSLSEWPRLLIQWMRTHGWLNQR